MAKCLNCCLQVGVLKGISFISFFRYTINAFVNLQYAERDDGCGVMHVITQQQRQAAAAAAQVSVPYPHVYSILMQLVLT